MVSTLLFVLRIGSDLAVRGAQGSTWMRAAVALVLAAILLLAVLAGTRLVAVPMAVLLSAYVVSSYLPWLTLSSRPGRDINHGIGFVYYSFYTPAEPLDYLVVNAWALLPIVAAVAGAFAFSPRRGLRAIGLRRLAIWTGLMAGTMAWGQALPLLTRSSHTAVQILPFITVCAAACGLALGSTRGRRSAIVFLPLLALFTTTGVNLALGESRWWLAVLPAVVAALTVGCLAGIRLRQRDHSSNDARAPEPGIVG